MSSLDLILDNPKTWDMFTQEIIEKYEEEGQFLEFKSNWKLDSSQAQKKDVKSKYPRFLDDLGDNKIQTRVLQTFAAFMNADGGCLILGLNDNGKLVGSNVDEETISKYFGIIYNTKYEDNADKLKLEIKNTLEEHICTPNSTSIPRYQFDDIYRINIPYYDVKHEIIFDDGEFTKDHKDCNKVRICRIDIKGFVKPIFYDKILRYRNENKNSRVKPEEVYHWGEQRNKKFKMNLILSADVPDDVKKSYGKVVDKFENKDYKSSILEARILAKKILQFRILEINIDKLKDTWYIPSKETFSDILIGKDRFGKVYWFFIIIVFGLSSWMVLDPRFVPPFSQLEFVASLFFFFGFIFVLPVIPTVFVELIYIKIIKKQKFLPEGTQAIYDEWMKPLDFIKKEHDKEWKSTESNVEPDWAVLVEKFLNIERKIPSERPFQKREIRYLYNETFATLLVFKNHFPLLKKKGEHTLEQLEKFFELAIEGKIIHEKEFREFLNDFTFLVENTPWHELTTEYQLLKKWYETSDLYTPKDKE